MKKEITFKKLMEEAKDLMSVDGSNKEYDRGMCELIASVWEKPGFTSDKAQEIAAKLGIKKPLYRSGG